jgi:hypothetical protein
MWTHKQPDRGELDKGEEVYRVFLIARGNAPTMFDAVEESLNLISVPVDVWAKDGA